MDPETARRLPVVRSIWTLGDRELIAREYFAEQRTVNQRCAQIIEEHFGADHQDLDYIQMSNQPGNTIVTFRGEAIALIEEEIFSQGTEQCPTSGPIG